MKIVISKTHHGFNLSRKAQKRLIELGFTSCSGEEYMLDFEEDRANKYLIRVVEELKEEANGGSSVLKVVEIPDDIEYEIEEYDGIEWISEKHRTWE